VVVVISLPFVSPPLHCRRCSTRDPPPEQLLVGLGVSGVSFVAVGGCGGALVLVSIVVICFGGIWAGQHDTVRLRGSLGAYLVGIPLLGSPGVVLRAPDPKLHPHIPFRQGGGDSAAVGMGGWCPVSVLHYHYNGI
jgi:hypothetical protein